MCLYVNVTNLVLTWYYFVCEKIVLKLCYACGYLPPQEILNRWHFLKMKGKVLRRAFGIYLLLLVASWLLEKDLSSPLPREDGWKEVWIGLSTEDGAKEVPLRYRKRPGVDNRLSPVLLIHGSPMASDSFARLLQELPLDRTYLIPDLPGFGHSKYGFADYSFDGHADALKQLLRAEGLKSIHLVAYGQGGGPALKLLSSASDQILSLTLFSSIGVLEHELTGDYFLNRLLYGGQLLFFKLIDWGTPHFGLLDKCLLNPRYAENFYYSDMRPLRSIMERVEAPVLILHSQSDWLVPKSAALEHFRILPQSSIDWGKGGHMMLMSHPEQAGDRLTDFFASVENGNAPKRAQADAARLLEAMRDPQTVERAPTTLWITLIALGLGTLINEDLTCIVAGLLAARGLLSLYLAVAACFLGTWIGDMLLYATGRYSSGKLLARWPFKKMIASTTLESTRVWLNHHGGLAVMISRFMPGTRLPLYLTAGLVRMNVLKMMFWVTFAGLLWTLPIVTLAAYFGQGFSEWLIKNGKWMLPGVMFFFILSFFLSRMIEALLTFEGRRKLFADFQRLKRWEFWPRYVFYIPVIFVLAWKFLRSGNPLAFTACNPGMSHSGLMGESKTAILDHLKPSGCVPEYLLIPGGADGRLKCVQDWMHAAALSFPVVMKPDQGKRGKDVKILSDEVTMEAELQKRKCDTIVQKYMSGLEFGIFYLRHPNDTKGSIVSLSRKLMISVEGDGSSTLEELILDDSRAVLSYRYFFREFKNRLFEIPEAGKRVVLAKLGNHCRGALFLDGRDLITPELEAEVDRIARQFDGFYLGRFDIRCPSESDLKRGVHLSVLDLNGITSEPIHIYHPHTSLGIALKTVIKQWKRAHKIGLINISRGASVSSVREVLKFLGKHY